MHIYIYIYTPECGHIYLISCCMLQWRPTRFKVQVTLLLLLYDFPLSLCCTWIHIISVEVEDKVKGKRTGAQSWLSKHPPPPPPLQSPFSIYLSHRLSGGCGSHIVRMPSAWHGEALCLLCPPQVKMSPEWQCTMTGSMWLEDTPFGPTSLWRAFRWEIWQLWHLRMMRYIDMNSFDNMLIQWMKQQHTNYKSDSELNYNMHLALLNNGPGPRQFLGRGPVLFCFVFLQLWPTGGDLMI